ncbi:MAG: hypothetical protein JSS49_15275 [Planctomycetes bacterium]|nr:hypothetical protein [Planctomycetota bacterium]
MKSSLRIVRRNWADGGLSMVLLVGSLSGCNWSPTSLAVENPSASRPATVSLRADDNSTTSLKSNAAAAQEPSSLTDPSPKQDTAPSTVFQTANTADTATTTTADERVLQPKLSEVDRSQLLGRWQDQFYGKRILTLNDDGTARMELELDFAGRLLYGKRLDFDMKWSLDGARVFIDIVDGKPTRQAKSLMDTWGSRYEYLLDCVENHQVEMRAWDGSTNHVLRRLPDETPVESPPEPSDADRPSDAKETAK